MARLLTGLYGLTCGVTAGGRERVAEPAAGGVNTARGGALTRLPGLRSCITRSAAKA